MSFFINETAEFPIIYFGGGGPSAVKVDIVADGGALHPSAVFTRASAGTTEITQGVFSQAPVNTPRYQWIGGKRSLLIEVLPATNLLFPSANAATMSTAVTAQQYTLSFFGTGSVTLSGASTGVIAGTGTTLKTYSFTPTAGSLTLTVAGQVTNWQLEAGYSATSRILTTSVPATRAADLLSITPAAIGFDLQKGTFLWSGLVVNASENNSFFDVNNGSITLGAYRYAGNGHIVAESVGASAEPSFASAANSPFKFGVSYDAAGFSVAANNTIATNLTPSVQSPLLNIMNIGISRYSTGQMIGNIFSLSYQPKRLSDAELQGATA